MVKIYFLYFIEIFGVPDLCEIKRLIILCVDKGASDVGDRKVVFAGTLCVVDESVEQARKGCPEYSVYQSRVYGLVDVDALDARFYVLQSVLVSLRCILHFFGGEIAELEAIDRGLHHGLHPI